MSVKIALAGNPNSGKTTLFNALTGSNQFVGNWPGVTVEKKEGKLKKSFSQGEADVIITDLPGIYSLSPYTMEEIVSRTYLLEEKPDVILNIIDGTNLERNLYLSTQLMELGIPIVIAVNMIDIVEKKGDILQLKIMSEALGCDMIGISALKGAGIQEVIHKAILLSKKSENRYTYPEFDKVVELAIVSVEDKISSLIPERQRRFYAIKLLEKDENIQKQISNTLDISSEITQLEKALEDDVESIITNERYQYISTITKQGIKKGKKEIQSTSDKVDKIITNRWLALPIFAIVMFLVYYVAVTTVGTWATDWANDGVFGEGWNLFGIEGLRVPGIPEAVGGFLEAIGSAEWLNGLILDGIIGGVGAVLGFVPQMLVLFAFLAFLESCGYMARVAFIMDRLFRKFGLSGKSFIPMLIGSGCSVPGIMASRTIENGRDRKMTIITTSFIPCGAKLPIIALISGALFGGAWWIAPSAYFIGIAAVICSGIILKKTRMFSGEPAPFVMELPAYHLPTCSNILRSMWERGWSFIRKAGTVILISSIVIWFMTYFGWVNGQFRMLDYMELDYSILAAVGNGISIIFAPLGFGDWKSAVAVITGLVAKENVVGTFGILHGFAEVAEDGTEIWGTLAASMTPVAAYSFLVFNLLCAPCFAAMGALKREMNSKKWFWFAVLYQTGLAYAVSLCIYQIGTFLMTGVFSTGIVAAVMIILAFFYLILRPYRDIEETGMPMKQFITFPVRK